MAKFSEVLTIINGKSHKRVENPHGKYPIYGSGGIMGYANDFICDGQTVIIGRKGSINKPIFVDGPLWNVDTAFGLSARADILLPKYLYYFCEKYDFEQLNTTVTIPSLTKANLLNIDITLPSLSEQEKIVKRLDKIDNLSKLRKQQLAKLDKLVKARFVEMFGDPVQNSMGWPIHQLEEYILFLTSGSRGWSQYFSDSGKYFITIKNVKNCCITLDNVQYVVPPDNTEAKRTKVQEGDLLISITADLGRTGVVTKEIADYGAFINQHLTCIRLNRESLHPLYVAYYMESDAGKIQFQSKNQTGVKAGLNFDSINSLNLMVPPLEKQSDFIGFEAKISRQKLTIQQSLDKLEMLKKSLMQEYFE